MRFFFLCSVALLGFLKLPAQSKSDRQVLDTEQRRFEAMVARDTVVLKRLLHEDLVYSHSNAMQENKQQHLAAIASGRVVYAKMTRETVRLRHYGKTALTNGTLHVSGNITGNPFDIKLLYTAVYHKQKNIWRLVNWQSTRVAPRE